MTIPPFSSLLAIAAHAPQAPANPGSLPININRSGVRNPGIAPYKKAPEMGGLGVVTYRGM